METIRLYHSTRFSNLANILRMGVMTVNNPHKEGHGDMLWFTTSDDYGSEVRISIDVPQEDFDNGRFEFVNKNHVVTLHNVSIQEYNFTIDSFSDIYLESIGAYYGGFKGERLVRLANNEPHGAIEEMTFSGFYEEYANKDKNIQVILNYIRNKQNTINEKRNMKKTIKLNESQLKSIVRESLKSYLLKEYQTRGTAVYCPADRELSFDWANISDGLDDIMFTDYIVTFNGEVEPSDNAYGWGAGYPGSSESHVVDDGGFSNAVKQVDAINPEWADALMSDFQNWTSETEIDWN